MILLLFPGLFLLRRTPLYRPFLSTASTVLAALAMLWSTERVFEVDLGTDGIVQGFASAPVGYYLAIVFTVVSGGAHMYFRDRNALIATIDKSEAKHPVVLVESRQAAHT